MADTTTSVEQAYALAKERYAELGVDCDRATEVLKSIPISLHCWQGDDVGGFENTGEDLGGGLAVTGNYLGKARTPDELRADVDKALSLDSRSASPEPACQLRRDGRQPCRTQRTRAGALSVLDRLGQADRHWASTSTPLTSPIPKPQTDSRSRTCRRRRSVNSGSNTASPAERSVRRWARHWERLASRTSGFPTGTKTRRPTARVRVSVWLQSLDAIFAEPIDPQFNLDAVEAKLFGIGSESYVVGSHEFYLGYAIERKTVLCLDAGHFHPTEVISDKISSVMMYVDRFAVARQPRRALGQ